MRLMDHDRHKAVASVFPQDRAGPGKEGIDSPAQTLLTGGRRLLTSLIRDMIAMGPAHPVRPDGAVQSFFRPEMIGDAAKRHLRAAASARSDTPSKP
jgi:hypothetical protein